MGDDVFAGHFAGLCAGLCCLGGFSAMGGAAGLLAHRRMRAVEEALGARAEPPHEGRLLWYAGASTFWLAAVVLALAGLFRRDRARMGRDCTLVVVGHFGLVTVGSVAISMVAGTGDEALLPPVLLACGVAGAGMLAAMGLAAAWALRRARRLEAEPKTAPAPGPERFAYYAASLLVWPVGLVLAAVFAKPHNARVGAVSLCASLIQLAAITLAVCIGLPLLIDAYLPSLPARDPWGY